MKIVVVGGSGLIGSHTVAQLNTRGHDTVVAAPSTGVDTITGAGLPDVLDGADVVIDVTNAPSWEDSAVMEFFLTSTRNLLDAEVHTGVGHHVALSVVGTERMLTSGYFRAKILQESLIRSGPIPHTIVRATQFFEFITAIADTATTGDTVRLPPAKIQPIAAIDVAESVATASVSSPINGITEIAGPDTFHMDELVRAVLRTNNDPRQVLTDPDALYYGWVRLDDETLLPGDGAHLGDTRLTDWRYDLTI